MSRLPAFATVDAFDAWRADPNCWLGIAADIARAHALDCPDLFVFPAGSNLVVSLDGSLILKIFLPLQRHQFLSERAALLHLQNRLDLAIPEIVAEGERDGWPYLVITRVSGIMLRDLWPDLPERGRMAVLEQIGECIASVQRLPLGPLAALEPGWGRFIPHQIAGCRARHKRLGMPEKFLAGLDGYLQGASSLSRVSEVVLLTGEFTPENLLLTESATGWRLTGLIDFGDVMTGPGDYDLLGPACFLAGGMRPRLDSLYRGFGISPLDDDPPFVRRQMQLLLLHRYSNLDAQVLIEDWQDKAAGLEDLQRLIWPVA